MGNAFNKVYLDNKTTEGTKPTANEIKSVCRSPENKSLLFDDLHNHTFYIFPQKLIGFGVTLSHKVTRHAHQYYSGNIDVFSEYAQKSYLIDSKWYGCEECHYPKSKLSKHIGRLMASMSFNPFEYFPNSHTLNLKNMALNYTTNNFASGIWMQNFVLGDRTVLTSLTDPHEISENCNHVGAELTYAVTSSIIIGFRAKRSGFDNGFARIYKSDSVSFATRVALPSNSAVFSAQIGEDAVDLHISANLIPQLQIAIAMHSSLTNVAKNSVNYGFKLTLPEESAMISVAIDNNWKIKTCAKKKFSTVPIVLIVTTALDLNAAHKFGLGIEINT